MFGGNTVGVGACECERFVGVGGQNALNDVPVCGVICNDGLARSEPSAGVAYGNGIVPIMKVGR